jgi:hypothetical protein
VVGEPEGAASINGSIRMGGDHEKTARAYRRRDRDRDGWRAPQHFLGHRNIIHTVRYTELRSDRFDGFWKDTVPWQDIAIARCGREKSKSELSNSDELLRLLNESDSKLIFGDLFGGRSL